MSSPIMPDTPAVQADDTAVVKPAVPQQDYSAALQAAFPQQQDSQPTLPQPPKVHSSFLKRVWSGAVDLAEHPVETAKSIVRGGVSGLGEVLKTAATASDRVFNPGRAFMADYARAHGEQQVAAALDQPLSDFSGTVDTVVGGVRSLAKYGQTPTYDASLAEDQTATPANQKFVESLSQFTTGMLALGGVSSAAESILPKASGVLGRIGVGAAKEFATGAVVSGSAFDPHQQRLSDIVAQGPDWIGRPIAEALASKPTDSELLARGKAAVEGGLLAIPFSVAMGGVSKALQTLMPTRKAVATTLLVQAARDAADHPEVAAADIARAEQVASRLHPDDVVDVQFSTANKYAVVPHSEFVLGPDGKLPPIVRDEVLPSDAPRFDSEADADAFAASVNNARRNSLIDGTDVVASDVASSRNVANPQSAADLKAQVRIEGSSGVGNAPVNPAGVMNAKVDALLRMTDSARRDFLKSLPDDERNAYVDALANRPIQTPTAIDKAAARFGIEPDQVLSTQRSEAIASQINLNYIQTSPEAKASIEKIATGWVAPETVTHEQTVAAAQQIADALGTTPENVLDYAKTLNVSTHGLNERVTAVRVWLARQSESVASLARAAELQPENPVAQGELRKAMETLQNLAVDVSQTSSSVGRALEAHKIPVSGGMQFLNDSKAVADMSPSELRGAAQLLASSQTSAEVNAAVNSALPPRFGLNKYTLDQIRNTAQQLWINALLAKPVTHLTNFASNTLAAFQVPTEYVFSNLLYFVPGLGRILRSTAKEGVPTTGLAQQGTDTLIGLFQSLGESFQMARRALETGDSILSPGSTRATEAGAQNESVFWNWVAQTPFGRFAKYVVPSRLLTTADEFSTQMNYRAWVRQNALRQAADEGVTDAVQLNQRVNDAIAAAFDPSGRGIVQDAKAYADYTTYKTRLEQEGNGALEGYAAMLQDFANRHPAFKFLVPFIRTPYRIAEFGFQRTPGLALILKGVRQDLAQGGNPAAVAIARQVEGAALITGAYFLHQQGRIVGRGPGSPQVANQWREIDNRLPYSVRVGDKWYSFNRMDATFGPLFAASDYFGMYDGMTDAQREEGMGRLLAAMVGMTASRTYLRGPVTALDAFLSGQPQSMNKVLYNIGSGFVPNASFDNTVRRTSTSHGFLDVHDYLDAVATHVPGWSQTLEPQRNIFGEPVLKGPSALQDWLNPFQSMRYDPNKPDVAAALLNVGNAYGSRFSIPGKVQAGVDWTDRSLGSNNQSPYDHWLELVQKSNLRGDVENLITSPRWSSMSNEEQHGRLAELISSHYGRAKEATVQELPKLKQALQQQWLNRRTQMLAPGASQSPTVQQSQQILTP